MSKVRTLILIAIQLALVACSIKTPVSNQYKLGAFSAQLFATQHSKKSILVTSPEAAAGYQTEQMIYVKKSFELSYFANNAWVSPPADMLFPLIVQSLQRSGYFFAVASSPHSETTDYRLDTQLIEVQQNFMKKPSVVDFVAKVVLTHIGKNRVVASQVISLHEPCPMDSPYGGVIAANRATEKFTAEATRFVVAQVRRDTGAG